MYKFLPVVLSLACFPLHILAQSGTDQDQLWLLMNKCDGVMQVFRAQEYKPEIVYPTEEEFNTLIAESVASGSGKIRYSGELSVRIYLKENGVHCISQIRQDKDAKRQLDLKAVLDEVARIEIEFDPGRNGGADVTCEMQVSMAIRKGRVVDIRSTNVVFVK